MRKRSNRPQSEIAFTKCNEPTGLVATPSPAQTRKTSYWMSFFVLKFKPFMILLKFFRKLLTVNYFTPLNNPGTEPYYQNHTYNPHPTFHHLRMRYTYYCHHNNENNQFLQLNHMNKFAMLLGSL